MVSVYFLSGGTGFLGSVLVSQFLSLGFHVFVNSRPGSEKKLLPNEHLYFGRLSKEEISKMEYVFYLADAYEPELLEEGVFAPHFVVIGSGIIYETDPKIQQTSYFQEKKRIYDFCSSLTNTLYVVPGHFIQDIPVHPNTPRGLHSDTLDKWVVNDESLTSKSYWVTSLEKLVTFLTTYDGGEKGVLKFMSTRKYDRRDFYKLAQQKEWWVSQSLNKALKLKENQE